MLFVLTKFKLPFGSYCRFGFWSSRSWVHTVIRAVAAANLCASSLWCGFTNASDRQTITVFIHASIRTGFFCAIGRLLQILYLSWWALFKDNHSLSRLQATSYGESSYHRLLHRITIIERDKIIDIFQNAYHAWLIAVLFQGCYRPITNDVY